MNIKAQYIKQRLSLRQPLQEALDVVAQLAGELELKKDVNLVAEIEKVKSHFPSCVDFEREFPSLCFSIATGVGKTRLMGACIAWLYLKKGMAPRIKRISEYLGESYWNYLSTLNDLVILMDEAHRYHADASKSAINELKPVLGLELTATPIDEKGNAFRNVVYEYSLAQALEDGKYVKNPAIATRKNFRPQGLSDKEIEIIKLEDAISIHQDTKNEL